ncbi:uncharacterized protein BO97DRAFT_172285 [Aspergillus homomorphus CBS 101889]|uniref:Uncharacterized protein n=1 Tax=Aspergillus homomorphus (strain CBS 101889) TaxID=1450537 RepID=A0A395HNB2_ASPHC|nr:hypothetical protein BO97DRAFT_172285 [Aspergillus homomorphus CBS 101889]RAL09317.1 hypothetical protein BO97DRAFT_172285 [Aspergillus homomorphus CBS 101889]
MQASHLKQCGLRRCSRCLGVVARLLVPLPGSSLQMSFLWIKGYIPHQPERCCQPCRLSCHITSHFQGPWKLPLPDTKRSPNHTVQYLCTDSRLRCHVSRGSSGSFRYRVIFLGSWVGVLHDIAERWKRFSGRNSCRALQHNARTGRGRGLHGGWTALAVLLRAGICPGQTLPQR